MQAEQSLQSPAKCWIARDVTLAGFVLAIGTCFPRWWLISSKIAQHSNGLPYTICEKADISGIPHQRGQTVAYYKDAKCEEIRIGTIQALSLLQEDRGAKVAIVTRRDRYDHISRFKCYRLEPTDELDYVQTEDLATHSPCNKINMGRDLGEVISFAATPTVLNATK